MKSGLLVAMFENRYFSDRQDRGDITKRKAEGQSAIVFSVWYTVLKVNFEKQRVTCCSLSNL